MKDEAAVRDHLRRALDWEAAHAGFDRAVAALPTEARARRPDGLPWSAWELVEHIRLAQRDILDFCIAPDYEAPEWPAAYWPDPDVPPSDDAWKASLAGYRADRDALRRLAGEADLTAAVPNGTGQTFLRELLLVADHTAYHVGQLIAVRRLLGLWPPE